MRRLLLSALVTTPAVRKLLVLATMAAAATALTPPASAGPNHCRHLITDPTGDLDPLSSPPGVDDQRFVDLTAVDLKTDSRFITVVFTVADINSEATASPLRHSFMVYFGSQGKRYALEASREFDGDSFHAWVVTAGQDYTDGSGGNAWAMSAIADVTGSFNTSRNQVRVVAPLELFRDTGGLSGLLSEVHAYSWTGAGAAGAAAEGSADSTDRVRGYRMGSASCVH